MSDLEPSLELPVPSAPEPVLDLAVGPPSLEVPVGPVGATKRSRTPIYLALFLVVALSGAALFVAGFTLGTQEALSPGTAANDQALFQPYWEAYHKIISEYVGAYDPKQLVEGSIKGMFQALGDPYSSYMSSEEFKASLSGISGQFEGVGAEMASADASGNECDTLSDSCRLTVARVIRDSPAQAAGLQAGDVVVAVDHTPVAGTTLQDTVGKVRGPRGTQVTITIDRAGSQQDLTITRDVIKTEDVIAQTLANGTVGSLKVSGFSSSAADDFRTLLKEQLDAGIRSFVIDLRDDPGGFVDAALSIGSQFIGSGPVYWEQDASGAQTPHMAVPGGLATDPSIKVVVLVNGGSASASEILAGALHDTKRATLVGTQTYGKGTIQQWHELSNDSGGFRLSVAKWLTPDKTWIHGVGITPDVVLPVPDGTPSDQDPQLAKALEILATVPSSAGAAPGGQAPAPVPATPAPAPTPAGFVGVPAGA